LDCHDSRIAIQAAGFESIFAARVQNFNTVKEILMHICRYEDKNTAGKGAMLAWVLWNKRNNCVWNNEREAGQQGVKALRAWNEWNAVNSNNNSRRAGHDLRTVGISVMLTQDFTMKLVKQVLVGASEIHRVILFWQVRLGYKDNFQSLKVKQ
jgi:hypothetical protein